MKYIAPQNYDYIISKYPQKRFTRKDEAFSEGSGMSPEEIMTIYAFTGDDRLTLAEGDGRILLAEKGDTAYSAALGTCNWAKTLTQNELISMFRFIYLNWNSGER